MDLPVRTKVLKKIVSVIQVEMLHNALYHDVKKIGDVVNQKSSFFVFSSILNF